LPNQASQTRSIDFHNLSSDLLCKDQTNGKRRTMSSTTSGSDDHHPTRSDVDQEEPDIEGHSNNNNTARIEPAASSNNHEDDSGNSLWDAIEGTELLNDSSSEDDDDMDDTTAPEFRAMMHRVRCLFGALTFPIPPLAAAVVLTMFYFLGVAFLPFQVKAITALWNGMDAADFPDLPTCSHPLYPYSIATIVAFVYATRHDLVRSAFFTSDRGRRLYDKCVQGMALLYVYMGILLKQTCMDDVPPGQTVDSCVATCPHVTAAFSLYVLALECFSAAIFVPLLLLPCVYVWFVRRSAHRPSSTTRPSGTSHRRMQRVFDGLSAIQVVVNSNYSSDNNNNTTTTPLMAILGGNEGVLEQIPLHNKECSICMADLTDANVVRIKNCGHVFHKVLLWMLINTTNQELTLPCVFARRAYRTGCGGGEPLALCAGRIFAITGRSVSDT
jgi:RING-like zinc finger